MTAVQALTGGGGWPMTVWLTPDRQPFYGGTYFPPRDGDRGARVGLPDGARSVLGRVSRRTRTRVAAPSADARRSASAQRARSAGRRAAADGRGAGRSTTRVAQLAATFDSGDGGFGGAPKFPRAASRSSFLLRYHRRTGDAATRSRWSTRTLERMAAGGIYDHVGGGFHRYSTDARWLVPALREDAVRQRAARRGLPRGLPGRPGASDFAARRARDRSTTSLRDMTHAERRLLLGDGRRQRGRGGPVLRLDARGDRGRARPPSGAASVRGVLRRDARTGNFEGAEHPRTSTGPRRVAERFDVPSAALRRGLARARADSGGRARRGCAPLARREGPRRLERPHDLGLRRAGAGRSATTRYAARAAKRRRASSLGRDARRRPAAAELVRRARRGRRLSRRLRVLRPGAARPLRGHVRPALAPRGGRDPRDDDRATSRTTGTAASSRRRTTPRSCSSARSPTTTARSRRATRSPS